ncbi:SRPBCC family protein [Tautonia sociabilis]|uniref:Uncharacterized protein n=1 Tax=Tautonia sociabilis TaxID=2080755 RepID=A0A432MJA1_9BACT|nr:hypothetical protein [Tautonia sociabilis]RUL87226.1 hypothetical protein TsocGM_13450 [Tautonia sociabilis]
MTLEVEAEVTPFEPGRSVAWHGVAGSKRNDAAAARYVDRPNDPTIVHRSLASIPPGGVSRQAAAWLVGYDPRHQLRQFLRRTNVFLETGKIPHDASALPAGSPPGPDRIPRRR